MSKTSTRLCTLLMAAAILCSCVFIGGEAEASTRSVTKRVINIVELFDESYWSMVTGVTAGSYYACLFHSDGTLSYIRGGYNKGTANWKYSKGILTVYNLAFGESYSYKANGKGGFDSVETYTLQGVPGYTLHLDPDPDEAYNELTRVKVYVEGKAVTWTDAKPFIENGRTMVPLRATANAMNLKVTWNGKTSTASFSADDPYSGYGKRMNFQSGLKIAKVEYYHYNTVYLTENVKMNTSVINRKGRLYAPIRYLAEAFGFKVTWDGNANSVYIKYPTDYD